VTRYAPGSDELTGGRWVTKPGGLRVWEPDHPYRERSQDERAVRLVLSVLASIAAGPAFCECGCWLINQHETCPACSAAEQTEVA
jgi:hypothetical protein